MLWRYNDGGRANEGYSMKNNKDCVCRSISIATGLPYLKVFEDLNELSKRERRGKRKKGISNSNTGVYSATARKYMESLGWEWIATMKIGTGCRVHLKEDELPSGRLVVAVSKHWTAVVDGVIQDTHDPSRDGTRCVYGYFREKRNLK